VKIKMTLILVAIALVSFGLYGTGYAFHDGGVARCEGCHTMHNSLNGTAMRTVGGMTQYSAGPYLLQGADASTACLNCHGTGDATSSYHVSTETVIAGGATVPNQYTPGGDFSWIKYTVNSVGSNRGHNIVAAGYNYVQDARITMAPGGTYSAAVLGCSGCHNPHGQTRRLSDGTFATPAVGTAVAPIEESGSYGAVPAAGQAVGAYRLLAGAGYIPKADPSVTFANNPPHAVAPNSYNRTDTAVGGQTRVAYGTGMSEWCANCHSGIHLDAAYTSGTTGLRHPADSQAQLGAMATNYNAYVKSGDLTGAQGTAYNSLVPFEEASTDYAALLAASGSSNATLQGPDTTDTVACISCHRAHATGFANMMRYDISEPLITDATPAFVLHSDYDDIEMEAAYYGRNAAFFGVAQRVLCNKCHVKD
jgi:hypothetical protein